MIYFRKTLSVFSVALASAFALAAPAAAQDNDFGPQDGSQVGTRFMQEPETADAQLARWLQKRIANCVVNRHEDEVANMLANSNFYSIDFDALGVAPDEFFDEYEVGFCMGRVMRGRYRELYMQFQYSTMRNLLAEEAYIIEYNEPPVITAETPREVAGRFEGQRVNSQISTMAGMADCLVYENAQGAHDLLKTRPGSDSEAEIIAALGPVLVGCSNTRQSELTIPTSLIRQIVADGLWTRSYYAANPASGTVTIEESSSGSDR